MQAPVLVGLDIELRVVCGGDRGDDREAEAVTGAFGGAVGLQAAEGLQEPLDLVGRNARTGVLDRERRAVRRGSSGISRSSPA